MKGYLILYSSNIAVKGGKRSAIYCLDSGKIQVIPNTLYNLLKKLEKTRFEEVKLDYSDQSEIFDSYVNFLFKEKLAFFTESPMLFPKLALDFATPEVITSATVVFSDKYSLDILVSQLDECLCKHLRLFLDSNNNTFHRIDELLNRFSYSTLRSIELVLNYSTEFDESSIKALMDKHQKLSTFIICKSDRHDEVIIDENQVLFIKNTISELLSSELKDLLIVNHQYFCESQSRNPLFNCTAFIDANGNIKNGIFTKKRFGNIQKEKLITVALSPQFRHLWELVPEQLKDSEFRYCLYNPSKKINIKNFKNCEILFG